jgi:hypothetical protein
MAYRGWSTSNYLSFSAPGVTSMPLTMACWARTSINSGFQVPLNLRRNAAANDRQGYQIYISGLNPRAATADSSGLSNANATASATLNTWFHAAAVFAAANSRASFINGGNKGTEATSRSPTGIDRMLIGVEGESGGVATPWAPAGTGDIAEIGIWNVALTDAEVLTLSKGFSPLLVRPQNLVHYMPLVRGLIDRRGGKTLTMTGSLTISDHPKIIMPGGYN